jgi:hypothetical protein
VAFNHLPMITTAEQSFSPLRKTSGSEALLDVFFFLYGQQPYLKQLKFTNGLKTSGVTNKFRAM